MNKEAMKWVILVILIVAVVYMLRKAHLFDKVQSAGTAVQGDNY